MNEALVDTNVFIHAHANDRHTQECRAFLGALQSGRYSAALEVVVVHELSYAWKHYFKEASRRDIAEYLRSVLSWPGIIADKPLLFGALNRWQHSRLGFVDCVLAQQATATSKMIYAKNVRDLRSQAADVPDPLPN
jgi:predicted nucleic acid-binding protein